MKRKNIKSPISYFSEWEIAEANHPPKKMVGNTNCRHFKNAEWDETSVDDEYSLINMLKNKYIGKDNNKSAKSINMFYLFIPWIKVYNLLTYLFMPRIKVYNSLTCFIYLYQEYEYTIH